MENIDFNLIVAMTQNGIIGKNNKIPWYLPEDLKYFRELTTNSIVIMGRKTFDSLPHGPLKNRLNIVITRNIDNNNYNYSNVILSNKENIFDIIKLYNKEYKQVFIIGGSEIYNLFISNCKKLYITNIINYNIEDNIEDKVYFNIDLLSNYNIISKSDILTSKTGLNYMFNIYEIKNKK